MKHNFINTSDQPKLVFIAGSPRSGGRVTLASFDSHPDILCWPFEFFYFSFFYRIAKGRVKVPAEELNSKIDEEFKTGLPKKLKETNIDYSRDNIKSKALTESIVGVNQSCSGKMIGRYIVGRL